MKEKTPQTVTVELLMDSSLCQKMVVRINGQEYKLVPMPSAALSFQNAQQENTKKPPSLVAFVNEVQREMTEKKQKRSAEIYRSALNSFVRFLPEDDIGLERIDAELVTEYEQFLKERGISYNSSSFYMRVLRGIYNRAIIKGLITDKKPFSRVYTGIAKTHKRAIPLDVIREMRNLSDLTKNEAFSRDIFLFSFYTRGMSFVDIAYLTPQNIHHGMLTYRRKKTGQTLTMRWEPQMQDIVNRNPTDNPDYLLPIIKRSNGHERNQYRSCQRIVNEGLHAIGQKLQLNSVLTMYVARHSWASIAHSMDVPLNIISEGMGHDSEKTTQIYLKSLDVSSIDRMNADIIRAISEEQQK